MTTEIEVYYANCYDQEIGVCVRADLSDGAIRRLAAEELDFWVQTKIMREPVKRVQICRNHPPYPCDCPHKRGSHVHRVLRRVS